MRLLRLCILALLAVSFLFSTATAVMGGRLTASPDQLRALYVQRLVKYVSWPEGAGPKLGKPVIVAATDPSKLRPYFDSARFKLVQWPAEDFHVLVLTGIPEREAAAILKRVAGRPVLTISQNRVNFRLGVVVNFYMRNGKLKLEVNPEAAGRAGLSISSRLLQLAKIYKGESDGN